MPAPQPEVVPPSDVPPPPPSPPPVVTALPASPAARAQAEKLARQAAESLDLGNELKARGELDEALKLDRENLLAKNLMSQISVADPVAQLGRESFRYTVLARDTLAVLARQYLGDPYRFYILARYNDIRVPRGLKAGQVIRIPGKQRPPEEDSAAQRITARPVAPSKPTDAETPATQEPGPGTPTALVPPPPEPVPVPPPRPTSEDPKRNLIDHHYRRGAEAFTRQDLDTAIREWDRVLELDPTHPNATVRRQQAVSLRERIAKQKK